MQDIQSMFGDRRLRPHNQTLPSIKCPRCDSTNTKFCYYNNYNLSQPRHFCKTCRRYWTAGGVLRNVPVGGACRKSKKLKLNHSPETSSDGSTLTTAKNDSVSPLFSTDLPDCDVFPVMAKFTAPGELTAAQPNAEQQQWELRRSDGELTVDVSDGLTEGILDRTVSVGLPRSDGGGGFMSLDWQVDGDQGLFEFTGAVDQGFWSQNQWSSDFDHTIY